MTCAKCGYEYEATNQHTGCPACSTKAGTHGERDLTDIHSQVCRWFEDWETATQEARELAERDREYYDGNQWTKEELAKLSERNQAPTVKNRIAKKVNFLTGSEIKNRTDPKGLPRTPAHDEDVNAITDGIRYVCDDQDFDYIASLAYEQLIIEGADGGVVEHEVVSTPVPLAQKATITPTPEGAEVQQVEVEQVQQSVEIRIRDVPWDRLWWDLHSRKPDFSDARHKGITNWWDLDDAIAYYGERPDVAANFEEVLREALTHAHTSDGNTHDDQPRVVWSQTQGGRQRIRVTECYYRKGKDWWTCHYTKSGFVVPPKPTGYLDEFGRHTCSLVMSSAFVRRDGTRYGLVRNMIGPQDEINKRTSKALHWLSVDRTVAEEGAVLSVDEARQERAKPDGWVTLQAGSLANGRIQFQNGYEMAQGQLQLLQEAKSEIDTIGPEIPSLTSMGASASGRARQMAMNVGSLELARIEDNHKRWKREMYKQIWYRIRQFWPEEKWFRVRDDADRTGFRFTGLNRKMTRAQRFQEALQKQVPMQSAIEGTLGGNARFVLDQVQKQQAMMLQQLGPQAQQIPPEQQEQMMIQMLLSHPLMQQPFVAGDVAQLGIDIVLDESPDTTILQQEEYEQLTQQIPAFLQARPDMASSLLEMTIEASQLRAKKKLLKMMRKGPDPKQVQLAEMMKQLQAATAKAQLEKTQSETQLNHAKAQSEVAGAHMEGVKVQAEAQRDTALAMSHAASAGEKAGGGPGPMGPM
jgi:hypothetical protein